MTTHITCCGTSMQPTGTTTDGEKTITTYTCAICAKVAEVIEIPRLGWTITQFASQTAKDAAEAAITQETQALVDAPEPWDATANACHGCSQPCESWDEHQTPCR